jgi:hypothetical protein
VSDFNAIGIIFALGLATSFIWHLLDTRIWNGFETVATGINQNQTISMEYRHLYLHLRWLIDVAITVAIMSAAALGFLLFARTASAEGVRLFAYVCALIVTCGAVGWLIQIPFMYFHLRSVLRQAEAG